jgi:hypothetical protein
MYTLTLRALERNIRIDCEESETRALLAATYGHMKGDPGAPDLHYTVGWRSAQSVFFIKRHDRELLTASDDGTFLALFDEDIAIELQKLRRDLYFVHAAVLTVSDIAFMLVAKPGGGKSTVCWALSHSGFSYLSDELGPVDLETLEIHRYTRAVTLKTQPPASYPMPATTLQTSRGWHIAAEYVPGGIGKSLTRLSAVFFLQYDAGARDPALRRISAAEAAARLYANTLNALAHGGDGLDAAIRITTAVTSFELVTADLAATCGLLAATLKTFPRTTQPVQPIS